MQIQIIDPNTRRTTEWSGGTTQELFLYPPTGSYAERVFLFRISSATVQLPESHFTALPNVTRYLTPLSEGFYLKINGARWQYLRSGQILRFSGDDDVYCRGSGRDLNLMLKGAHGEMRVLPAGESDLLPHAFVFLYCPRACTVSGTDVPDDAFLSVRPDRLHKLNISAPAALFTIDL